MSYRDYLEEQKKYIRTKKEALEAKREKEKNPRPPKYDPPPASSHPLLIAAVLALALLPLVFLPFWAAQVRVAPPPPGELTLWIHSSAAEFAALQNWLEPELRANGLTWRVEHASSKEELLQAWRSRLVDLAVVEEELAAELHGALALAPLWDKLEGPTWENCFAPFGKATLPQDLRLGDLAQEDPRPGTWLRRCGNSPSPAPSRRLHRGLKQMAMVMGPTPGTGVMAPATSFTSSKSTSPRVCHPPADAHR